MPKTTTPAPPSTLKAAGDRATAQRDKFREAAREVEADDDEKRFDERLREVAKPVPDKRPTAPNGRK